MRIRLFIVILLSLFLSGTLFADEPQIIKRSGTVNFSVDAVNQTGYDCFRQHAQRYLLTELPVFFSSELAKHGLLFGQDTGTYRIALIIDENSTIQGYKTFETDKSARVVQTIINLPALPKLGEENKCVAGNAFMITIEID